VRLADTGSIASAINLPTVRIRQARRSRIGCAPHEGAENLEHTQQEDYMVPFRHHVFVCTNHKPDDDGCCGARGSEQVLQKFRSEVAGRKLQGEIHVTACGSLGTCGHGPNLVVHPDGVWYSGVTVNDVPEIVEQHLVGGRIVERLAWLDHDRLRQTIAENRAKAQARKTA
jgi:(2Fe-2S) ferredoxin